MIVLDASAAVRALAGDAPARRYLAEDDVAVPHLIDTEVMHALRGLVLGHKLEVQHALEMIAVWQALGVRRFATHPLARRIWALRDNLSAYDATYVALAEELQVALVTADARLTTAPSITCQVTVLPS